MSGDASLDSWIGRTETATDSARASDLARFAAIFGGTPGQVGDLPPLAHWMLFPAIVPAEMIGEDGHPRRGGFLPPVHHLPRRMWTGGRLRFIAPVSVGAPVERRSEIKAISRKKGGSGDLVFVTVAHTVMAQGERVLIEEEQDLVYRGMSKAGNPPTAETADAAVEEAIVPDEVMLFRYSAATFNGHRIHYDAGYARSIESYPGLVVHGPLTATLLLRAASRAAGATPSGFAFRAVSPAFARDPLVLRAARHDAEGRVACWAAGPDGRLVMKAEATFPSR
jgi:3-methylfumaryl-CoA hydratase